MTVAKRVPWALVGLVLLSVAAADAATLNTPMGPTRGIGGGNTTNACYLVNVSSTKAIKLVTITEYQSTFCDGGGCHAMAKKTVTCTNLQPTDYCTLLESSTALFNPVWCQFTVSSSAKNVRASMTVNDKVTGETIAVLSATSN